MTILAPVSAPVNSDPGKCLSRAEDWRWESGPEWAPVAPYSDEDAEWWAEQTREDQPIADDAPAYYRDLDRFAEEREAEDWLARGLLF